MFKKTLIVGAVLAASTGLAFANGGTYMPPAPHHTGHFYAGAAVSRDFVHFDTNQEFYSTLPRGEKLAVMNVKHDASNEGWNGDIFAGYGMTFQDHYYLAGEVFGSLSNIESKYELTAHEGDLKDSKKLELKHSYGISLIPGVKLSQSTMLYGRVGWVRSRFEINGVVSSNNFQLVAPMTYSSKKTEDGIQVGVGFDIMIANNCSIRGEYDWSRYGDIGASVSVHPANVGPELVVYNVKVDSPTVNQFKLAAVYHFMA